MAGADVIYGAGMLESGITYDLAQFVIDNEIARMIDKYVAGIEVSEETLAEAEIARVGHEGDYLSLDHTLAHMRDSIQPALFERRLREDWAASGEPDAVARARRKAADVLADHRAEPLPTDLAEQIRDIVVRAEKAGGGG